MSKISIYQVLVRLFGNTNSSPVHNGNLAENGSGKMNDFSPTVLKKIKSLGITHIWYTGLLEHATQTDYNSYGIKADNKAVVKGKAGSPYAVKDYYDVDPDLAVDVVNRLAEFEQLIARTHKAGLGFIMDFIPNHVARQYYSDKKPEKQLDLGANDDTSLAFSAQNNFYYLPNQRFQPQFDIANYEEFPAKATGNDQFTASPGMNDWYETAKLNYGVNYATGEKHFNPTPDTWFKMYDILHYWASFGVDGFRCDMAEMVPVEFWGWVIPRLKTDFPKLIFIAEVYNPAEYRNYIFNGKFDYLYDKVGLYDKLRAILTQNHSASDITHCWQSLNDIRSHMLNFLENHDEQRIASDFFCGNPSQAFPAMVASATLSEAPIMIYAGQELGEKGMDNEGFSGVDGRTTIFDYWTVDSLYNQFNGGKMTDVHLSAEQKSVKKFYSKLLNITIKENAITQGKFYDLQYANYQNENYNAHKVFSYFRAFQSEIILIVLNFGDKTENTVINIPEEAWNFVGAPLNQLFKVTDLMEDTNSDICISNKFNCTLEPFSAKILKMIIS